MKNMKNLTLLLAATFSLCACQKGNNNGLVISRKDAIAKVRKLAKDKGYCVNYDFTEFGENYYINAFEKDNKSFFTRSNNEQINDGIALEKTDTYTHFFLLNNNLDYEYTVSFKKDVYDALYANSSLVFALYNIDVKFEKMDDDKFLERDCNVYTFKYAYDSKKEHNYKAYVDKEYGMTMSISCTDEGADARETIQLDAVALNIGEGFDLPELPEVTEITEYDDIDGKWKVSFPDKIAIKYFHGERKAKEEMGYSYLEIIDKSVYLYEQDLYREEAKFYKFENGSYKKYTRDYYAEGDWQEVAVEENVKGVDDVLSWNTAYDIFDVTELNGAKLIRNDFLNGMPVEVYQENNQFTYYYSRQFNLFLLREDNKSEYRLEIDDISTSLKSFIDDVDDPNENKPNIFDYDYSYLDQ